MKAAGFIAFVIGIVVAITSGAKLAEAPARFPDTVAAFTGGAVFCLVGLSMWWKVVLQERAAARAVAGSGDEDASGASPVTLLEKLQAALQSLAPEVDTVSATEITNRIDQIIDDLVTPLAEARHKVIDQFGMAHGSEILVATAYGERMLNRVYSAAADGHVEEARSSFREAASAFDEATKMVSSD